MKVKIVRQIITEVEEVINMTPEQYCNLRADRRLLIPALQGQHLKVDVVSISPLDAFDEDELSDYFFNKK